MTNSKYLFLTWDDVQSLSEEVADKIKEDEFHADLLIAVSRGGFDPARIMSDQLDVRKLASLQVVYYTGVNETKKEPEILYQLNATIKGLRVLVVDDVSDSGNSLKVVKEYVQNLGAKDVRVATLHYKPWSGYKPNYYAEEVDQWIIYPWEPRESLINLYQKLISEGHGNGDAREKLMQIGFKEHQVARYLGV